MERTESKGQIFFRLCAWAGIAVILIMFLGIFARFFTRTVLVGLLGVPKENRIVSVLLKNRMKDDFKKEITAPKTLGGIGRLAARWTKQIKEAVENDTLGRSIITRMVNKAESRLGMQLGVFDGRTMYDLDGYLVWASEKDTADSITSISDDVLSFNDYFRSLGIPMLYVMIPPRVSQTDWINGTVDFSVYNYDRQAEVLSAKGVKTLDLQDTLRTDGLDHHALFFRTDHHWKPDTALWAASKISDVLTSDLGLTVDTSVLRSDRYRIETLKKSFLGALGKKVTEEKVSLDDLDLFYPVFETDLTVSFADKPAERGDYSLLYDMRNYDPSSPLSIQNPYRIFLHGDYGRVTIRNLLAANDTSLLVIGDSFDNILVPFLSLSVRDLDVFDFRAGSYGKEFRHLTEGKCYDCAIVMTNMTNSLNEALD